MGSASALPSKTRVDKSGKALKSAQPGSNEYEAALNDANQWRIAHIYPINTFQARLRGILRGYPGAIVAQRLKRMPTIIDKLTRHPNMQLSTMQDIAGVRAVLRDVKEVYEVVSHYESAPRFSHILKEKKDYINSPKSDGYRGIHLVYRYNNTLARTAAAERCRGLMVEVQLRSREQHIWATSVEAIGMILGESFKTHGGDKKWQKFFGYVSSAFAIVEGAPVMEEHRGIAPVEIYRSVARMAKSLRVFDVLSGYTAAVRIIDEDTKSHNFYHLIQLDTKEKRIRIRGYSKKDYKIAMQHYLDMEKQVTRSQDVVLVSAGQLMELKRAYPNYFLDINAFRERLSVIIEETNEK